MSIAAATKLGRYEIRAKVGESGMGEVYRAYPAKMNRFVSAALRSLLSLLLVAFTIPFSQASTLSASHLKTGRLFTNSQPRSGNPIITGWYADPEAHIFKNEYWVYPTYSAAYENQVFFDAFSSKDLITWKKHPRIFANVDAPWVKRALWAPSVVEKGGWYYLFFGANDIQNDQQLGGIGVARSRQPGGPFKDYLGKPLIDKFHNGAQPIDQFVFRDASASYYIIYGGWRHCNIAKLKDDFTGLLPFADGATYKEITPKGYVEGAFMFVKDGKYYFMWSEGGWTGPDYAVAYAVGSSVFGPFERIGKILAQNPSVATGAGHHSVLHRPGSSRWYIVYHRRPLGETDRNHRVVCIDEMRFDEQGLIQPVVITKEGVPRDALP
jgi:beta-xylosidase